MGVEDKFVLNPHNNKQNSKNYKSISYKEQECPSSPCRHPY